MWDYPSVFRVYPLKHPINHNSNWKIALCKKNLFKLLLAKLCCKSPLQICQCLSQVSRTELSHSLPKVNFLPHSWSLSFNSPFLLHETLLTLYDPLVSIFRGSVHSRALIFSPSSPPLPSLPLPPLAQPVTISDIFPQPRFLAKFFHPKSRQTLW